MTDEVMTIEECISKMVCINEYAIKAFNLGLSCEEGMLFEKIKTAYIDYFKRTKTTADCEHIWVKVMGYSEWTCKFCEKIRIESEK